MAVQGGDPYDTSALVAAAQAEGLRRDLHPFFYPPPFLLAVAPTASLPLPVAWRSWYLLDALALLAAAVAAWAAWRSPWTLAGLGLTLATFTPVVDSARMGQANTLVLALMACGLVLAEGGSRREVAGGALVGLACMAKMSPALLVAWWLLRGRWRPALAAVLAGVVASAATLPLVPLPVQLGFYREVLPGFASGEYHGLAVPVNLFANHSLANLWTQAFPSADGAGLSPEARRGARLTALVVLAALVWRTRTHADDALSRACGLGAVCVAMVVLPVYTYEHHMTLVLPAWLAVGAAAVHRRLPRWSWPPLVLAFAVQAAPLQVLRPWALELEAPARLLAQEAKFLAALAAGLACLVAAGPPVDRAGPPPAT